jgi:hypothetical protein
MFYYCLKLTSIPLLDMSNVYDVQHMFSDCESLTDLEGFKDLGKQRKIYGLNSDFLDNCPNLTHESLMNVINNLYDRKSEGYGDITISFGETNLNKISDSEKAIAINKGWILI